MAGFIDITMFGTDGTGSLQRWEGNVPYFYLDNRKINNAPSPLVTLGIGCALGKQEALTLPLVIGDRPATITEIADDFTNIENAPFGYKASYYAQFTVCRLPSAAITALCQSRLATFVATLEKTFPGYDAWPDTCKAGTLDLIYGLGVSKFLSTYPMFISLGKQTPPNFTYMAAQSGSDETIPAYNERNQARRLLFLQGAA